MVLKQGQLNHAFQQQSPLRIPGMPTAESSPKQSLSALLSRLSLTDNTGALRSLSGKRFILFYFSAHWCGPCRQFTPTLRRWYQRHAAAQQLEVVFVSNDRNEADFNDYFSSMPWSAPSHSEMPMLADALQLAYGLVSAIPTLLVVDAVTMDLLTSGGCPWVKKDASASAFPWHGMSSPPPDFGSGSTFFSMVAVVGIAAVRFVNWYRHRNSF